MAKQFVVNTSPHIKAPDDIARIMRDVCIALAPAMLFGLYRFGYWAGVVTLLAVFSCMLTEYICQKLRRVPVTVDDWSAVVTGLLLAAVIPPNVSWFVPVTGGVIAIGVAKHCFGGLGSNIFNPALIGRAFLQAAFPTQINSGVWPAANGGSILGNLGVNIMGSFTELAQRAAGVAADATSSATYVAEEAAKAGEGAVATAAKTVDVITSATPLEQLSKPAVVNISSASIWIENGVINVKQGLDADAFLGMTWGCIGEISALALLLGGLYMLARKIIGWQVPVGYIVTAGLLSWILPAPYKTVAGDAAYTAWFSGPWLLHLAGGGLFIGAFFMATDMVTSPMSRKGKLIFGCGCGFLTVIIRLYAGYPEGVCYSILLMNMVVPIIDSYTRPRVFGTKIKA